MKALVKLGLTVLAIGAVTIYGDYRELKGYLSGTCNTAKAFMEKDEK